MFVVSVLLARVYGATGYGDFIKVTTYVGIFYLFADFGLNAVFIQIISGKNQKQTAYLWQRLLGLRIGIALVCVALANGIMALLPTGLSQGYTETVRMQIMWFAPIILFQAITTTTNAYFQKILRYDLATKAQNLGSVVLLFVAVSWVIRGMMPGSSMGLVSVFFGSVVTAAVALWYVRARTLTIMPTFDTSFAQKMLISGWPLGMALVFNLIYFHADSVLLTMYRSTEEVGVYGLAYKVFELPLVLPIFFMNAVYPILLRGSESSRTVSGVVFKRSFLFLLFSALVLTVGVWIVAPWLSLVKYEFAASTLPLRVLSIGYPVYFLSSLYMWFLIAQRGQKSLVVIHGIGMFINIILNMIWIPMYGYIASAWITIGVEFVILCATAMMVHQKK